MIYFQLYGFYPSKIVKTLPVACVDKTVVWTPTIFNFTLLFVQIAIVYYNSHYIFTNRVVGKVVDICRYVIVAMTCFYTLIESILTIDDQKSFWSITSNLTTNFQKILQATSVATQNRVYKKNLLKTYVSLLTYIGVQIYLLLYRRCIYCDVYNVLVFYALNRNLQYILYVDVIHQQAVNLECELDRMITISKYKNGNAKREPGEFLVNRLKVASSFYIGLYEMSLDVNNAFGWSMVLNLLHSYINIAVEFYWMFEKFTDGDEEYFYGIITYNFTNITYRICYFIYLRNINSNFAVLAHSCTSLLHNNRLS